MRRSLMLAAGIFAFHVCANAIGEKPTLGPGDFPPRFVGRELTGKDINLDLASGKAYVITFWASWCEPCLEELPVLSNIQKTVGAGKIQVVAVNIEDRAAYRRIERLIRETGITSAFDPDRRAQYDYNVSELPHMVIVGSDGKISSVRKGYARSTLDSLAAEITHALAATGQPQPARLPMEAKAI
jgi:thiol-disulfide isomerase/thioredoxin